MLLSNQTDLTGQILGMIPSVGAIADAGFDCVDISMFCNPSTEEVYGDGWQALAAGMNAAAKEHGVTFNQAHAPFPTMRTGDSAEVAEYNAFIKERVIRSIRFAGLCGVKNIVVHPVHFPDRCKERNVEMYAEFVPVALDSGVRIAIENMWGHDGRRGCIVPNVCSVPEELSDYYDTLEGMYPGAFNICLDLGHCGLVGGDAAEYIRAIGHDRLGCLHIHDNDYRRDSHLPPFIEDMDWKSVTTALRDISYKGDFTFEADNILRHMPAELVPSCLKFMHDIGRHLIKMYEG